MGLRDAGWDENGVERLESLTRASEDVPSPPSEAPPAAAPVPPVAPPAVPSESPPVAAPVPPAPAVPTRKRDHQTANVSGAAKGGEAQSSKRAKLLDAGRIRTSGQSREDIKKVCIIPKAKFPTKRVHWRRTMIGKDKQKERVAAATQRRERAALAKQRAHRRAVKEARKKRRKAAQARVHGAGVSDPSLAKE